MPITTGPSMPGHLLALALEAGYATAFRAAGLNANLVLKRVLDLRCYEPVPVGKVVQIRGRQIHRGSAPDRRRTLGIAHWSDSSTMDGWSHAICPDRPLRPSRTARRGARMTSPKRWNRPMGRDSGIARSKTAPRPPVNAVTEPCARCFKATSHPFTAICLRNQHAFGTTASIFLENSRIGGRLLCAVLPCPRRVGMRRDSWRIRTGDRGGWRWFGAGLRRGVGQRTGAAASRRLPDGPDRGTAPGSIRGPPRRGGLRSAGGTPRAHGPGGLPPVPARSERR